MNENKILFISDAHLGMNDLEVDKERERKLVRFLRTMLRPGDRLFIVGDLFDFWFEYRTVIPKDYILVLSCLQELSENGVRIDYIAGNHDFWAGNFFRKNLGLHFHPEPLRETIGDKTFYIIHGDGLKKDDRRYRILKRVFRSRLNIFFYRWLHPDIGVRFARRCSSSSRKYNENRDFGGEDEYISFAEKLFSGGVDHVIMAHTHHPFEHKTGSGKSLINLGDWINHFTYAQFSNNTLTLETYKSE